MKYRVFELKTFSFSSHFCRATDFLMSYVPLRFTIYGPVHLLLYCRNYKFQNPQILANEGQPWTTGRKTRNPDIPDNIYLFKINNKNIRKRCEICWKLTWRQWRRSGVFIVNFEHISHLFLVSLFLTLNK